MSTPGTYRIERSSAKRFLWRPYPKAQRLLEQHLSLVLAPFKKTTHTAFPLQETSALRDAAETSGLRFFELLDHLRLAVPQTIEKVLEKEGFVPQGKGEGGRLYRHAEAVFPPLVIEPVRSEKASMILELAIKAEHLEQLRKARGYSGPIQGEKESSFRKMSLGKSRKGYTLSFVERKGSPSFKEDCVTERSLKAIREVRHLFGDFRDKTLRTLQDPEEGFRKTFEIVLQAISQVGRERAAYEWVEGEAAYWQKRNRAATLQGKLQEALGIGWVNKDHVTYRNSKTMFPKTVELLEKLGFRKREILHAEEFTAQVMENACLGVAAFIDVDPAEKKELGTVGLWVKVHGESLLSAGLHHMAARFDFQKIHEILGGKGIPFRPPFSNFDDLKQAFTEGEKRVIPESHARRLLKEGLITETQLKSYVTEGAVYTHLEAIQRGNGFKGFNPRSVERTLRDTGRTLRLNKR